MMSDLLGNSGIREIPATDLESEVATLMDSGARLMYATGVDLGIPGFRLDYYFCFDEVTPSRHLLLRTIVDRRDPSIPSVTPVTTQADWPEREMIEFLGIRVKDHPDPRHLWLPLNWDDMHTGPAPERNPRSERINTGA
ncbi:MAG: NADH-quinone oxidoreductase subunit C, partial [Methanospirillum sp.]|nr:NADH-quinone oxidoreductase subunit C [Methanospirillum sp.]